MCPRCHSTEITRSRSKKLRDALMLWLGMKPYRCKECRKRFHLPAKVDRTLQRERAWRRSADPTRKQSKETLLPAEPVEIDTLS